RIEGKTANPRRPELPKVDGLRMQLLGPSRNSYTFYDGRKLIEQVGVQYVLELQPSRPGEFEVPSFPIWTGTKEQRTPVLRLEAKQDLIGAELGFLELEVEPRRVYVHEPVRVRLDYGVQQGVRLADAVVDRYRYQDIEIQAPWLDSFPGGERLEVPQPDGETRIAVCNRLLIRAGFDGDHEREGQRWQHYSFERAFLPTRLGKIELPAPMLRFRVVRRSSQRDRFGRPLGQATENYYVYGEPLELEVLPIPEEGRPTPYYGAVGRFTLEASLDRAQVRVGDSIKLTLTVRGRGNFEFLRLPELDDLEGFHKLGANEAERGADKVVVTYDLTPLSADVRDVPAIAWNFFDTTPGVEAFVEVATTPLALDVQPLPEGEQLAALPEAAASAVTPGVDDIHDLPPLDGPPVRVEAPATWLRYAAVLGPWLLVVALFFARRAARRAAADVTGQRARGARRAFEARLQRGGDVLDALAGYLADRLDVPAAAVISPELAARLRDSGLDEAIAREVAALVDRGTAARYGGGGALTADEARAVVQRLEQESFGPGRRGARTNVGGAAPLLAAVLLPALLGAGGAGLRAQHEPGVRAYRDGDYSTADAAFAEAWRQSGDRRLLRARGNCYYRMGDYPRARWAYESARLGLPRDPELLANLRVVRRKLDLPPEDGGFSAELRRQLDRLRVGERAALGGLLMLLSAGCLVFGWRRVGWRWCGLLCLAPGLVFAVDVAWLEPARPVRAVALEQLDVRSEPRDDLAAVATVRAGA
ncbi:MAG: BatD family protein, partial [Planctomycetes bacterium]|nr:BatD family protein [Planctomycetota bacterium]